MLTPGRILVGRRGAGALGCIMATGHSMAGGRGAMQRRMAMGRTLVGGRAVGAMLRRMVMGHRPAMGHMLQRERGGLAQKWSR